MGKRTFEVELRGTVKIEIDDEVIERGLNAEWQKDFYEFVTAGCVVDHVAYNLVVNRIDLSDIDGFADMKNEQAKMVGRPAWEITTTHEELTG